MSVELFRRARRAEARAERAEDRRRLRLEFFRQSLAQGFDSLKVRHAEGASGQESVRTHARLMDDVIFSLTRLIADDADRARLEPTALVVTALGGYGRGELHPLSDIDLMVVYDGEQSPYVQRMMQELLYSLWDLGLQVGHSLRSLDDCVAMARTDFPSRTSMQEARFLAGDRRLFGRFSKVLRENVYRRDFAQFLETTLTERDQRYRRYGASPYIGEPNVKESAGGLRDVHTAMWLGAAKFGARTLRAHPAAVRLVGADVVCSVVYGLQTVLLLLLSRSLGFGARFVEADNRRVGRFLCSKVLARAFAELLAGLGEVQDVVNYLEGQA